MDNNCEEPGCKRKASFVSACCSAKYCSTCIETNTKCMPCEMGSAKKEKDVRRELNRNQREKYKMERQMLKDYKRLAAENQKLKNENRQMKELVRKTMDDLKKTVDG